MWIKMKDIKKRHNLRWKWYDPEGNLYYDTGDFPVGSEGSRYGSAVTWHKIGIFGDKASEMLGDWVVKVAMDNSPLVRIVLSQQRSFNPISSPGYLKTPKAGRPPR